MIEQEEFTKDVLDGMTIAQLQKKFSKSRAAIYAAKKKYRLNHISPNVSKKLLRESGSKCCSLCGLTKELTYFYSNGRNKDGTIRYKPNCNSCTNTADRESFRLKVFEYLASINKTYSCEKCSYTNVFGSLDFHHVDPTQKDFEIGASTSTISQSTFDTKYVPELNKCVLLCPNCHRMEHLTKD